MQEECLLYDRECINCGECDKCDLDSTKHCDNCGKCIDGTGEYRTVKVEEFTRKLESRRKLKKK